MALSFVTIPQYQFTSYHRTEAGGLVGVQRVGKYRRELARDQPHPDGRGIFKEQGGHIIDGYWAAGVPHGSDNSEVLDGLPTPFDPHAGGFRRGRWFKGEPRALTKRQTLRQRYRAGNEDSTYDIAGAGFGGFHGQLPGHFGYAYNAGSFFLVAVAYVHVVLLLWWFARIAPHQIWDDVDMYLHAPAITQSIEPIFMLSGLWHARNHPSHEALHK